MITRKDPKAREMLREWRRRFRHLGLTAYTNHLGGIIRCNAYGSRKGFGKQRGAKLARSRINAIREGGLVSPFVEWCNRLQQKELP